jgi:acetyl esterase/lipase
MFLYLLTGCCLVGCSGSVLNAQGIGMREQVYKQTPERDLKLTIFDPPVPEYLEVKPRPGIVFFHGGGWNKGGPKQFFRHARHLAERGMVAISAEYRLKNTDAATPIDAAADALSAMRWVRAHADELGIDPDRLAAGGGSAGGQLAAVTATLDDAVVAELAGDDTTDVSARPQALVLFNPVYDNGPDGYGQRRFGDRWETFSPLHNLHPKLPPTLVMLGDQDNLIPVTTAENFRDRMTALGVRSELVVYPDQPHGFFNNAENGMYQATVAEMTQFLASLGWIDAAPANK